tara:strand:+ start:1010 stop:1930 length:921 start_codon:yes stop_codon:yes gene_type:complete
MNKYICISGSTASGKSALALKLSNHLSNSVVINVDAQQVYKCWEILTDRPLESKENDFRLYGHVSCKENYNAGNWLKDIEELLSEFNNTNKNFIFVGGTGLYFNSLLNGLSRVPQIEKEIKQESIKRSNSINFFIRELTKKDPETLEAIDKKNIRRLQRAWEVVEQTGKGLTYWHKKNSSPLIPIKDTSLFLLDSKKEQLNKSIEKRIETMIERGVIDEVNEVYKRGWNSNLPFAKAIGAIEIIDYLENESNLDDLKSSISIKTQQFAKKQRTWQRKYMSDWKKLDNRNPTQKNIGIIAQELKRKN